LPRSPTGRRNTKRTTGDQEDEVVDMADEDELPDNEDMNGVESRNRTSRESKSNQLIQQKNRFLRHDRFTFIYSCARAQFKQL
ncbi:3278_t:CDS:1, partial [Paraglomus brasilianum]